VLCLATGRGGTKTRSLEAWSFEQALINATRRQYACAAPTSDGR